jgi:hypothetical protein
VAIDATRGGGRRLLSCKLQGDQFKALWTNQKSLYVASGGVALGLFPFSFGLILLVKMGFFPLISYQGAYGEVQILNKTKKNVRY